MPVFATFLWNAYTAILRKQTHFLRKQIKSSSIVNEMTRLLAGQDNHCLVSRALKEHLMSLKYFIIKYNVQTKNITKVSRSDWHIFAHAGRYLNAPEFSSQNLIWWIFSTFVYQLSLLSLQFNFHNARK